MPFGASTITFTTFEKSGDPDEYGNYTLVETSTSVGGARHRPLTHKEVVDLQFDVATQWWRSTLPLGEYDPADIVIICAVPPNSVIDVDGERYQIDGGVRPHPDMEGRPFKMTIISKKQIG